MEDELNKTDGLFAEIWRWRKNTIDFVRGPLEPDIGAVRIGLSICDRHAEVLQHYLDEIKDILPISEQSLAQISGNVLDGLMFRFIQLQDAMMRRVLVKLVILVDGLSDDINCLDYLRVLQVFKLIESDVWLTLAKVRDAVDRDQYLHPELAVDQFNQISQSAAILLDIYKTVSERSREILSQIDQ